MDVRRADGASPWDAALTSYAYPPFTQRWAWGDVQASLGKRVERLRADTPAGPILAQWIEERRGPLSYWFAPQGPVLPVGISPADLAIFLDGCRRVLPGGWRACFDRCEPRWRRFDGCLPEAAGLSLPGWKRVRSLNPSTNMVVPIQGTAEELLERLHKKTRYNIRLAERHHVLVRGGAAADLPVFLALMAETAVRDGFRAHAPSYLRAVVEGLCRAGCGRLRIAEAAGIPLAANFEALCGDTVTYLYGASSSRERERMAPYALQWSALFAARQEGFRWYDFGGGNPEDPATVDFSPGWEGITRFKERWATVRASDPGTYDRPRRHWLYRFLVRR